LPPAVAPPVLPPAPPSLMFTLPSSSSSSSSPPPPSFLLLPFLYSRLVAVLGDGALPFRSRSGAAECLLALAAMRNPSTAAPPYPDLEPGVTAAKEAAKEAAAACPFAVLAKEGFGELLEATTAAAQAGDEDVPCANLLRFLLCRLTDHVEPEHFSSLVPPLVPLLSRLAASSSVSVLTAAACILSSLSLLPSFFDRLASSPSEASSVAAALGSLASDRRVPYYPREVAIEALSLVCEDERLVEAVRWTEAAVSAVVACFAAELREAGPEGPLPGEATEEVAKFLEVVAHHALDCAVEIASFAMNTDQEGGGASISAIEGFVPSLLRAAREGGPATGPTGPVAMHAAHVLCVLVEQGNCEREL